MAALAAASCPSTSAVGSRSAMPSSWASRRSVAVAGALLLHAGEDVVGRAVHDAHDAHDLLSGQRFAQRPDDGDGPRHRRLVEQVDAGRGRDLGQLGPGDGEQRLVGRHHRLAVAQRRFDQFVRGVQPSDDLDHHIDIGSCDQCAGIRAEEFGRDGSGPGSLGMGHGDPDELQADAGAGGDILRTGEQYLGQRASDVAAAEQADAHGRSLMGVREGAVLGGGHLQTVQVRAR